MAFKAKTKDVTLSDGRKFTVRNLNGADEMLALELVASQLKQETLMAGLLLQGNVQVVLSVLMIDDKPAPTPRTYQQVLEFLSELETKDLNLVRAAYHELNGMDEGFLAPSTN